LQDNRLPSTFLNLGLEKLWVDRAIQRKYTHVTGGPLGELTRQALLAQQQQDERAVGSGTVLQPSSPSGPAVLRRKNKRPRKKRVAAFVPVRDGEPSSETEAKMEAMPESVGSGPEQTPPLAESDASQPPGGLPFSAEERQPETRVRALLRNGEKKVSCTLSYASLDGLVASVRGRLGLVGDVPVEIRIYSEEFEEFVDLDDLDQMTNREVVRLDVVSTGNSCPQVSLPSPFRPFFLFFFFF
jgi:hypothetical protein